MDPFRSKLGRFPREPLQKASKQKGVGLGSALYYEDVAALNHRPAGGDHFSAQFRYKRPLCVDLDADQARFAAYDPYEVRPRRPETAPTQDPKLALAREVQNALHGIWANLEVQTAGEASLLQFRQAVERTLAVQLPTAALQRIHQSLSMHRSWAQCEAHHTRHGVVNLDLPSLVPVLVDALEPHKHKGKMVDPQKQWRAHRRDQARRERSREGSEEPPTSHYASARGCARGNQRGLDQPQRLA